MQTTKTHLSLPGGAKAFVHCWRPDGKAKAALQIIHGMAEHGGRYARLAQTLTARGYAVYAQDLPGHGHTAGDAAELGHVRVDGGWDHMLDQIRAVNRAMDQELGGVRQFVLGHSMGGYLLQHYVTQYGRDLQGAIFSGCSGDLGTLRAVGLALIRIEGALCGWEARSVLGDQLSFKDFNRRFKPTRTDFDWLSRDEVEVSRYLSDEYCGFRCSCAFWRDLLIACGQLNDPERLNNIPKTLPVLIVCGSEDTAAKSPAGPEALEASYRRLRLKDLGLKIYEGARHELLNETCRDQVTQDLLGWLDAR